MSAAARSRASGIAAAAGLIAAATLAARIVGFGRWLVFSGTVGNTCVGEAYATANQLPNVLFEVAAGGALAAVVIPLVGRALHSGDRAAADRTASALLTWALLVLLPLAVLLALLAGPLTAAMLGDQCASPARDELAVRMLIVFAPQVPLYAVGIVLGAVLQAHRRFLAAAISPLLSSLVVIAAYLGYGLLADGSGDPARLAVPAEAALAGGTTLGVVALSLPLLWPIHRAGVRLRPTLRFPAGTAARAGRLAGAGMLALVAQQLAVLATVWVANHRADTGALNVYTYVQAVYLLPYAVLAVPIATAAFPSLVTSDHSDPPRSVLTGSLRAALVAGGLGAGVLVAAAPAVGDFFARLDAGRAAGGGRSLAALADALTAYAPGLIGFAAAAVLQRALYARGPSWRTGAAVACGWLVAAVLPVVLLRERAGAREALTTLGWSSTLGLSLAAVVLAGLAARSWGSTAVLPAVRTAVVVTVGAALAGSAGRGVADRLSTGAVGLALLGGCVAGVIALVLYLIAVRVGDPESLERARWWRT